MRSTLLPLLLFLTACTLTPPPSPHLSSSSWSYWLQGVNASVENLSARILVLDADDHTFPDAFFTRIAKHHVLLAYESIGEAEAYRAYWNATWHAEPPAWILEENPAWEGNYLVQYWHPAWERIILERIREAREKGFSGVYLDKIDAFETIAERGVLSEAEAAQRMGRLVRLIREEWPQGMIFLQNGERIFAYAPSLVDVIDGIAVEDVWQNGCMPQPSEEVEERLALLHRVQAVGKPVLVVEYVLNCPNEEALVKRLIHQAEEAGFSLTLARHDRALDTPSIPAHCFTSEGVLNASRCALPYVSS